MFPLVSTLLSHLSMIINTTGTDPDTNYIDTRNICDQTPGIETDIRDIVIIIIRE